MTPRMAAQSAAERAIGPMWSRVSESAKAPARLTRPRPGLSPVTPQPWEGKRIEPPVSVPSEP